MIDLTDLVSASANSPENFAAIGYLDGGGKKKADSKYIQYEVEE